MLSTRTGLSPALARLSRRFRFLHLSQWASPRSLATTSGVSVDVLSSSYLDVSVRSVRLPCLCIQHGIPQRGGFPHSDIRGSTIARISPRLFAACHVLHRLSVPRHPPDALLRRLIHSPTRRDTRSARRRNRKVSRSRIGPQTATRTATRISGKRVDRQRSRSLACGRPR